MTGRHASPRRVRGGCAQEHLASPLTRLSTVRERYPRRGENCRCGGQPDSVALSSDKSFLAVAIENERDEDVNDGAIPQMPSGNLKIVPLAAQRQPSRPVHVRPPLGPQHVHRRQEGVHPLAPGLDPGRPQRAGEAEERGVGGEHGPHILRAAGGVVVIACRSGAVPLAPLGRTCVRPLRRAVPLASGTGETEVRGVGGEHGPHTPLLASTAAKSSARCSPRPFSACLACNEPISAAWRSNRRASSSAISSAQLLAGISRC